jgi:hypothetical protein
MPKYAVALLAILLGGSIGLILSSILARTNKRPEARATTVHSYNMGLDNSIHLNIANSQQRYEIKHGKTDGSYSAEHDNFEFVLLLLVTLVSGSLLLLEHRTATFTALYISLAVANSLVLTTLSSTTVRAKKSGIEIELGWWKSFTALLALACLAGLCLYWAERPPLLSEKFNPVLQHRNTTNAADLIQRYPQTALSFLVFQVAALSFLCLLEGLILWATLTRLAAVAVVSDARLLGLWPRILYRGRTTLRLSFFVSAFLLAAVCLLTSSGVLGNLLLLSQGGTK